MPAATSILLPDGSPWVPPAPPAPPGEQARRQATARSFENATRGRGRPGPHAPLASPNAHRDSRTLEALIRDCQAAARDNHLARAMLGALTDMIVGHRPVVEARSSSKDWNREVEKRFEDWSCEHCDAAGRLSLWQIAAGTVTAWMTDGGLLINKIAGKPNDRRGGMLECVEVARLRNPAGRPDSRTMHAGVELTERGRPLRYHVAQWSTYGTYVEHKTTPIDAANAWLLNNPRLIAPNQHRCEPGLTSVLDRLETLDRAVESTFGAYELATYIALFIERADPQQSLENQMAQGMVNQGMASSVAEAKSRGLWQPLGVLEGRVGEKITQIKPEFPSTSFQELFWMELQTISAALDLPPEMAFYRFIRNYSASRSALAVCWRAIQVYQRVLIERLLRPAYRWWLAGEQIAGRIARRDDWDGCEWFLPTMPVLDREAEVRGHQMALSSGLELHEAALRELGQGDRAGFMAKFAVERRENAAAGLAYSQPVQVTRSEQVEPYGLVEEDAAT